LISGLVLAGCSLLSNVGQVPSNEQSGVNSTVRNFVTPTCIDFEALGDEGNEGDSVEGFLIEGMLNIELLSTIQDKKLVLVKERTTNLDYLAYRANKVSQNDTNNGCLIGWGFAVGYADISAKRFKLSDTIVFSFPVGVTVSHFFVDIFDYGDWYPDGGSTPVKVILTDNDGNTSEYPFNNNASAALHDACEGTIGIQTLEISGYGISEVTLSFVGKMDPGIAFDNVCFTVEPIGVPLDIKPTSCPNPLNVKSQGVLPGAILGTEDFDVNEIDPNTVRLEGVSPVKWAFEDVATPYEPIGIPDCRDCSTDGPDGYLDLVLHFNTQDIINVLENENLNTGDIVLLDTVTVLAISNGDCVPLTLTGELFDGIPIICEDWVVILKKVK
jgi:hypothetical protein